MKEKNCASRVITITKLTIVYVNVMSMIPHQHHYHHHKAMMIVFNLFNFKFQLLSTSNHNEKLMSERRESVMSCHNYTMTMFDV